MSFASSAVTYTSVYTDSEPGRVFWGADKELSNGGSLRVIVYGYDGLPMQPVAPPSPDYIPGPKEPHTLPVPQDEDEREPMFIQPHDPDYVLEPMYPKICYKSDPEEDPEEYEDDETEDGPVDYPMDEGDDGNDDDDDSSGMTSTMRMNPVIPPPSTDTTTTGARITVQLQAAISLPPEAEVERFLAMPILPPSPLTSLSPLSIEERLARMAFTQALIDAITVVLPSLPLPPPLYIPPPVDRRDDIPETEMPPRKRLCFFTLGSRYETRESSTARPTVGLSQAVHFELQPHREQVYTYEFQLQAHQTQLQLQGTLIQTQHQSYETRFQMQQAEIAELRETDRTEGVVGLTQCIKKMESVFQISGYAIENQVKFATCTLLDATLTWWDSQIRSLGPDAYLMTWDVLKKKMTYRYCPQGEIKKLEIKLWNLKVKGNDVSVYTERFQELTLICTKFVANETEKIDKNSAPIQKGRLIRKGRLMIYPETTMVINNNPPRDRMSPRNNEANPKGNGCFECGAPRHFKRDCPKLKNKDRGNVNAQGWVYVVGNAEKKGNASRDPNSNVITGTFLLNNRYASILFDTGADRSFISIAFSSLIEIVLTPLGNSYDVELADGKIVGVDTIMRGCCNTLILEI
nr:reverse transcriptase domain-containing protein [Tanacetum cinerariifolium]